jgi:hypothetical protein
VLLQSAKEDLFFQKWRTTIAANDYTRSLIEYCKLKLYPGWPLTILDAIIVANCMGVCLSIRCSDGKLESLHYPYLVANYANLGSWSDRLIGLKKWVIHWNIVTNKFTPILQRKPLPVDVKGSITDFKIITNYPLRASLLYVEGAFPWNLEYIANGFKNITYGRGKFGETIVVDEPIESARNV